MQNYVSMSGRQFTTKLQKSLSFYWIKNKARVRLLQTHMLLPRFKLQKSFLEFKGTTLMWGIEHMLGGWRAAPAQPSPHPCLAAGACPAAHPAEWAQGRAVATPGHSSPHRSHSYREQHFKDPQQNLAKLFYHSSELLQPSCASWRVLKNGSARNQADWLL